MCQRCVEDQSDTGRYSWRNADPEEWGGAAAAPRVNEEETMQNATTGDIQAAILYKKMLALAAQGAENARRADRARADLHRAKKYSQARYMEGVSNAEHTAWQRIIIALGITPYDFRREARILGFLGTDGDSTTEHNTRWLAIRADSPALPMGN